MDTIIAWHVDPYLREVTAVRVARVRNEEDFCIKDAAASERFGIGAAHGTVRMSDAVVALAREYAVVPTERGTLVTVRGGSRSFVIVGPMLLFSRRFGNDGAIDEDLPATDVKLRFLSAREAHERRVAIHAAAVERAASLNALGGDVHYVVARPPPGPTERACCACGATDRPLMNCAACRQASYCSRECQRANWRMHKPSCRAA